MSTKTIFNPLLSKRFQELTIDTTGSGTIIPVAPALSPYSANNNELVEVDATANPFIINLPTAVIPGQRVILKKVDDVNPVTVIANGVELIDGNNSYVLKFQYESITVISTGVRWLIV